MHFFIYSFLVTVLLCFLYTRRAFNLTGSSVFQNKLKNGHIRKFPDSNFERKRSIIDVSERNLTEYWEILSRNSDEQGWITLIEVAGDAYVDFGINFFLTSIENLNIRNYLFIVYNDDVMRTCSKFGMNCYMYLPLTFSELLSRNQLGGLTFKEKTALRLYYTLDAINLDFNVFTTDADVILFKNPLPYFLNKTVNGSQWDLAGVADAPEVNNVGTSFYRRTNQTRRLLKCAIRRTQWIGEIEQIAIANCRTKMKSLKVYSELLDAGKFYGAGFWDKFGYFATDCDECYLVHSIKMGRQFTKKIVLKESLMWNVDNGGYYSAKDRKYLQVAWIGQNTKKSQELEYKAALSLSKALNRILIAPMFECHIDVGLPNDCPLYQWMGNPEITQEDKFKVYHNLREHYFLLHPLVPKSVSQSTSDIFFAQSDSTLTSYAINNFNLFKHFQIRSQYKFLSPQQIFASCSRGLKDHGDVISQFKNLNVSVLRVLNPKSFQKLLRRRSYRYKRRN